MVNARFLATMLLAVVVAACVPSPRTAPPPPPRDAGAVRIPPPTAPLPPRVAGFRSPPIMQEAGLERIIRAPAPRLLALLGQPQLDVREDDVRKLQFAGSACVLDVFLYPLTPGAEPVATWVEARRASDGASVGRAACVAALSRR